MNMPLLYRAARQGTFGKWNEFSRGSIADALFVYLDGEPETGSIAKVSADFRDRPLVCLTKAWKKQIETQYPDAAIYRRFLMKPTCCFSISDFPMIPDEYHLAGMDENAFAKHPFSHGKNYASWAAFQEEGSGAVVYYGHEIVAAASSFISLSREVELDVFTAEAHREKNLAAVCIAWMLRNCMERGITVHWDAQNEISLFLAKKFGFEIETEYFVYWLPKK